MKPFMQLLMIGALGGGLVACTPPDVAYCKAQGASPMNLQPCLDYYRQQEQAFTVDLAACAVEADKTYPQSLYADWGTALVRSPSAVPGGWSSTEQVSIPPDTRQHAELDRLRMKIITPCMQARGWNSGVSWQDGRRFETTQMDPNGGGLPWAK